MKGSNLTTKYFLPFGIFISVIFLTCTTVQDIEALLISRNHNCSRFISEPCKKFDIKKFSGEWNFLQIYSPLISDLKCLKLKPLLTDSRILLHIYALNETFEPLEDVSSSSNSPYFRSTIFGLFEDDCQRTWTLFSDKELVPSKWIILDQSDDWGDSNEGSLLYMICSNIPQNKSLVGEIGILSKSSTLLPEISERFQKILTSNNINVNLSFIGHDYCPNIRQATDKD